MKESSKVLNRECYVRSVENSKKWHHCSDNAGYERRGEDLEFLRRQRLRWFGHVERIDDIAPVNAKRKADRRD